MTMRPRTHLRSAGHWIGGYGLLALSAVLFGVFSLILPDTFPTMANITALLSSNSITAILALGAMIPIVAGGFDVSIGYGLGLWHVLTLQLLVAGGWPWVPACLASLVGGAIVGTINGFLVEVAQIGSFVATLGTGSVMYAITGWMTKGARIVPGPKGLPAAFTGLYDTTVLGVPIPAFYVLLLAVILWIVLERLPLGRHLYVIGENRRAAALVGVPVRRCVVYAFAASGAISGAAGALFAAREEIGDPSVGIGYLLPAFVGALLGSTVIRPGRPNALGTVVAVAVLAIGLSGIEQLGADFWVTPLFNGVILIVAVGLAGYSARRRVRAAARPGPASSPPAVRDDAGGSTSASSMSPAPPKGDRG
ncbi:ABC transporter permease [Actinoallomurus rhizosphaericola]|uniref:ABC transporter permease n=1 Tax=Actinoallomurus rhizosphaericola TaxID=2952536 RepID=UPI002091EB01|nr:ABC transporter permease [Actinoallomurus rhizosphaericola]MCO5997371.1 ABC transporter permease [Actinoallomurus rhizosphaericola]